MMFLDCPAYLDHDGAVRCGLPAEVTCRFTMRSTGGPLESAIISCPAGHHFNGPIESLTWDDAANRDPGAAGPRSCPGRGSLRRGHGRRGSGLRDSPAEPDRKARRPNGAPAYYLGRPAALWVTAMHPAHHRLAALAATLPRSEPPPACISPGKGAADEGAR